MTELETIEHQQATRLARWSATLGTLGLLTAVFGIGVLLALVGIGCAILALNHLATLRSDDARGVALIGLVAGVLALLVFPLLLATAVPSFIAAREKQNHERCYSNLIVINRLRQSWAPERSARNGSDWPGQLKCPSGGKYKLSQPGLPARCSIPIHNEPPGRTAPSPRLRFSFLPVSPFAEPTQVLAPLLPVGSTLPHATKDQLDCARLVGLHHA